MSYLFRDTGQLPPCTWPVSRVDDRSGKRIGPWRCDVPALYAFRLRGWPAGRKAPVCAAHAGELRRSDRHPLSAIWLSTQRPPDPQFCR